SAPVDGFVLAPTSGVGIVTQYDGNPGACTGQWDFHVATAGAREIILGSGLSPCNNTSSDSMGTDVLWWVPATVQSLPGPGQGSSLMNHQVGGQTVGCTQYGTNY